MGRISTAIAANAKNNVINGAFDIWQRGTSNSVSANVITYTADRWAAYSLDNTLTVSRITATTGIQGFGLKLQRNASQTGTNTINIAQSAETVNSTALAGKTITLTFRAKAGTNFSATSNQFSSRISTGAGTDQNRLNGFTGQVDFTQVNTLTTSFQTFKQTVTLAAGINQFAVVFFYAPTGTAGADDSVTIEQVVLTEGSVSPAFSRFGRDIEGELAACLRYYYKVHSSASFLGTLSSTANNTGIFGIDLPSQMRTTPTVSITTGGGQIINYHTQTNTYNGAHQPTNHVSLGPTDRNIFIYSTAIGHAAGDVGACRAQLAGATLAVNAEI